MRIVRASELGAYLFCRRAWKYQQQGLEPANRADLDAGTALHELHGRQIFGARLLKGLAYAAFLLSLGLLVAGWVLNWLMG